MTTTIEFHDLDAPMTDALEKVRRGEEVTVVERGQPIARIVLVESSLRASEFEPLKGMIEAPEDSQQDRELGFGMYKGQIWMAEDFDAPLPEEGLREWEK